VTSGTSKRPLVKEAKQKSLTNKYPCLKPPYPQAMSPKSPTSPEFSHKESMSSFREHFRDRKFFDVCEENIKLETWIDALRNRQARDSAMVFS
jgi:hypothetical protein